MELSVLVLVELYMMQTDESCCKAMDCVPVWRLHRQSNLFVHLSSAIVSQNVTFPRFFLMKYDCLCAKSSLR